MDFLLCTTTCLAGKKSLLTRQSPQSVYSECGEAGKKAQNNLFKLGLKALPSTGKAKARVVLPQRTSSWRWRCRPAPPSSTGRPAACAWGSWWSCQCRGEESPAGSRLGPRCKPPTESAGRPRSRSGRWSSHPERFPPQWPAMEGGGLFSAFMSNRFCKDGADLNRKK